MLQLIRELSGMFGMVCARWSDALEKMFYAVDLQEKGEELLINRN